MYKEDWMSVEVVISDGTWTIGYIDGDPAEWYGNGEKNPTEYNIRPEDSTFEPGDGSVYQVQNREWVRLGE